MKLKKRICLLLALLLTATLLPRLETGAYAAGQTTLTFSDGGVAATLPGSGCTVSGTTLTVTASGSASTGAVVSPYSMMSSSKGSSPVMGVSSSRRA